MRPAARDGHHGREARAAGKAENVARRIFAQIGHSIRSIEADRLADFDAVEKLARCSAIGHALDLEMPFSAIGRDIAHRIGARALNACHAQQCILAGQEFHRHIQLEAEFADVMGEVVHMGQRALGAHGQDMRLVMIGEANFDRAIAMRIGLASEPALALHVALRIGGRILAQMLDFAFNEFEAAIAA